MDEIFSDFSLVKANNTLDDIVKKLKNNGYFLDKSYYILDIYMINRNIVNEDISFNSLDEVSDYLILRDYNNEKKEILLFNDGIIKGKVQGIFSAKYIVETLGYEQIFTINKDIYFYTDNNNIITIIDIKDVGVYIDKASVQEIESKLGLNYIYEDKDYINELLLKYVDNRKRGNI